MRRIFIVALGFLVFACAKEQNYSIKGTAAGIADGTEIYLEELGQNNQRIALDTAVVTAEAFVFTKPREKGKGIQILRTSLDRQQLLLVKDQAPLTITLYKDSIPSSLVTGSKANELFNTYTTNSRRLNKKKAALKQKLNQAQRETDGIMVTEYNAQIKALDEQYIQSKKQVVTENTDNMVAIMALSDLINAKVLDIEETEGYFDNLSSDVKESSLGGSIKTYIAQRKSQRAASKVASVGNKAPEFSAPTPDGKELALSETLGKYTIIDFWASWCKPCRMENPNVVSVYNKYLSLIHISEPTRPY